MKQLAPERIAESLNGVLGSAVTCLQWNAAISQRGADLNDHPAIARQHSTQSGKSAIYVSQIGDFSDALKFFRGRFFHWRKHRCHRVVDPHVDRAKLLFGLCRGGLDCRSVSNIER